MITIPGIPGTISDAAAKLRWHRMEDHGGCRRYQADTDDGFLIAMVGREPAGISEQLIWHLSVSHRDKNSQPDRCPDWDELKHAAYRLVPADVPLVLIFPRRSKAGSGQYVDVMQTCLHLWECELPVDV